MMSEEVFKKLCKDFKLTEKEEEEYRYYDNYKTVESIKKTELFSDEVLDRIFHEYEKLVKGNLDEQKTIKLFKEQGMDISKSNQYWWAETIFNEVNRRGGSVPEYYFTATS